MTDEQKAPTKALTLPEFEKKAIEKVQALLKMVEEKTYDDKTPHIVNGKVRLVVNIGVVKGAVKTYPIPEKMETKIKNMVFARSNSLTISELMSVIKTDVLDNLQQDQQFYTYYSDGLTLEKLDYTTPEATAQFAYWKLLDDNKPADEKSQTLKTFGTATRTTSATPEKAAVKVALVDAPDFTDF